MAEKKHSTFDFFRYIKKKISIHLYLYVFVNALVGLLDGLGIALFIPLLTIIAGDSTESHESLGKLRYFTDFLQDIGISLSLVNVLIVMVVLFALKGGFSYIRTLYNIKLRLYIIKRIRFDLIECLSNVSYNGFTQYNSGKIQNTLTVEVNRMTKAMTLLFESIQSVSMLLTYVLLAFFSNWQFAILVAIGGFISNFIYKYINKITKEAARNLSQTGTDFNTHLIQILQNFKYLKATNYVEKYDKKIKDTILKSQDLEFKMSIYNAITEAAREPITILIIALVIILQVNILGSAFSSILVSLLFFYRALTYLTSLQSQWNMLLNNVAGYESVSEILEEFSDDSEPTQKNIPITKIKHIEATDISLSYGDNAVLNHVSLHIKEKESLALVGESGAGKTTLANVICGLAKPDEGSLLINNEVLEDYRLDSYRNKIGYISQDPVIFNDTIFNNITFWDEKTPKNLERFWQCINLVALDNFMENLSKKEDATLGSNGILVSGGQKQRISIARELYKDVDLLIMDEATSALDSETEKHIKESIDSLQGKYMMVIIAHRLSTIKNVDMIYLMENGNVIAQGNYDELYTASDRFKKMVDIQNLDS